VHAGLTNKSYAIPPEQVVGSSGKLKFEMREGKPDPMRLPEMNFVDDKAGKPVGINSHIGRRPIAAFGNSDGDQEMLEWTRAGDGTRLMMLVPSRRRGTRVRLRRRVEDRHVQ